MRETVRFACIAIAAAAALGGCSLFRAPAPAYVPEPTPMPEPMPAPEMIPEPPSAAPPDTDRGLPVCPGDPRCKKMDPGA